MKRNYLLVIVAAALVLLAGLLEPPQAKSYGDNIDHSLALYNAQEYQKSIETAQSALKLQPNSAIAYINICAAYNQLQQWDKAILACEKALAIDPELGPGKEQPGRG